MRPSALSLTISSARAARDPFGELRQRIVTTGIALACASILGGCAGPAAEPHPKTSAPVGVCAPDEASSPPPPVVRREPAARPVAEGCGDAAEDRKASGHG